MLRHEIQKFFARPVNRTLFRIAILLTTSAITLVLMVFPISSRPTYYALEAGNVAPQDIQAPSVISYPSEVATEQMRQEAEDRVNNVFLPADPAIARKQVEMLRSALNFITSVRADSHATPELKIADLSALENIQLNRADADQILNLTDTRWQMVQQESLSVLEQTLRDTVREDLLKEAQRRVPTLISFSLPQDLAGLVENLVTPFVVPNSRFSSEMTTIARQEARNKIEMVTRSYAAGEIIVRRGQIITDLQMEALDRFGLIDKPNNTRDLLANISMVTVLTIFTAMYFSKRKISTGESLRSLVVIAATFLIFLYAGRLVIPNRTVLPYLFPVPAFGLTVAVLFHAELGMVLSLILSLLTSYGLSNSLDLSAFYIISSLFGILILGKGHRTASFFWAGIGVGAAGSVVVLAYRLPGAMTDLIGVTTLTGAAFFNGITSASLTLVLQFVFAQLLGLATALQLLEISRPDHPLQQFVIQNAPGSYQHSLQVAIMAEQAAEKIGADALLVRVGAIYHDAGKSLNPSFFIENQVPGKLNPHDDLDPALSAQTIIRHVTDGAQLARKHRLPSRVIDFIFEHHGTLMTRYQYAKALEKVGGDSEKVDITRFRYPGPRPQSRETALLMLADGCQARARAEVPEDEEAMRAIIRKVVDFCQKDGQLDDTRLTLRDLNLITESFVNTLQNTYHPRIRYPEPKTEPLKPARQPLPELPEQSTLPVEPVVFSQEDSEKPIPVLPPENTENLPSQLFKRPLSR